MKRLQFSTMCSGLALLGTLLASPGILTSTVMAAPNFHAPNSIRDVTLSTGDVSKVFGSGLRTFLSETVSNKELAKDSKASGASGAPNLVAAVLRGRVTGYTAVWARMKGKLILSVTCQVNQFLSDSYARAGLQLLQHYKGTAGAKLHLSPTRGVGDTAIAGTVSIQGARFYVFVLQRGAYLAVVEGGMLHGRVKESDVARLATIEDQRIQANS